MSIKIEPGQFLVVFFSFVLFFPQFLDQVGLLLEYVLMLAVVAICWCYVWWFNRSVSINSLVIALAYFVLLVISLVRSSDIVVTADFFELFKPILFFFVFNFGRAVFMRLDEAERLRSAYGIMAVLVSAALWGCLESVFPQWNQLSAVLYKGGRVPVQNKALLSFISPYAFAAVLVFPVAYFLLRLLTASGPALVNTLGLLFSFSALVFTQSRTVAISFVVTLVVFLSYLWCSGRVPRLARYRFVSLTLLALIVVLVPVILLYVKSYLPYLYGGLELLVVRLLESDMHDVVYSMPSISNRYEQMEDVISMQDAIPLLGVAVAKNELVPESLYAMYLLRVGLFGLLLHFGVIAYAVLVALRMAKLYREVDDLACTFFLSVAFYLTSLPLSYFSSAVNDQVRSGFLFYILLALLFSFSSPKKAF